MKGFFLLVFVVVVTTENLLAELDEVNSEVSNEEDQRANEVAFLFSFTVV